MFNLVRERFDVSLLEPHLIKLYTEEEYDGVWDHSVLFVKNLINIDMVNSDPSFLELTNYLKTFNIFCVNFSKFAKGTIVHEHVDTDLVGKTNVKRCFIPLEEGYKYEFSGTCLHDGKIQRVDNLELTGDVFLVPQEMHSYKNLDDFDQYFILADIIDDVKNLPEDFWENYFKVLQNYI